jgi:hypothetical protein
MMLGKEIIGRHLCCSCSLVDSPSITNAHAGRRGDETTPSSGCRPPETRRDKLARVCSACSRRYYKRDTCRKVRSNTYKSTIQTSLYSSHISTLITSLVRANQSMSVSLKARVGRTVHSITLNALPKTIPCQHMICLL